MNKWGKFSGNPKMELLPDGRDMRLLEDFSYQDRSGKVWTVPAGAVVNGANVPGIAWSVVGGPWDGPHRNASVLHDWYCATRTEPWDNVQLMFFEACMAGGMSEKKATQWFLMVKTFCPKWEVEESPKVAVEESNK